MFGRRRAERHAARERGGLWTPRVSIWRPGSPVTRTGWTMRSSVPTPRGSSRTRRHSGRRGGIRDPCIVGTGAGAWGRRRRGHRIADLGWGDMTYEVTVEDVAARPTAVVAATTTWQEFPALWKAKSRRLLRWAFCLHRAALSREVMY